MSGYTGVSAMLKCAVWLADELGVSIESIGRGALDRKDSRTLEACGKYLAYTVVLDGRFLFLRVALMDEDNSPEELLSVGDTKAGWKTMCQVIRALERNGVRSLERPIAAGSWTIGLGN